MQISNPYIAWNNVPKFHENRASVFERFPFRKIRRKKLRKKQF